MRDRSGGRRSKLVACVGGSITHGYGSTGYCGWRALMFSALHGYGYVTCGSRNDGSLGQYAYHDGYDGYCSDTPLDASVSLTGIMVDVIEPAFHVLPDIIIVDGGINDLYHNGGDATLAATAVKNLRTAIRAWAPLAKLLEYNILPCSNATIASDAQVQAANALIAADCSGEGVRLVDMYTPMAANWVTTYSTGDGVHPNDAGYAVMAPLIATGLLALGVA